MSSHLRSSRGPMRLNSAPYTLHPAPCTLHPTPYTLHPTPYNLYPRSLNCSYNIANSKPYTLYPVPLKRQVSGVAANLLSPAHKHGTIAGLSPALAAAPGRSTPMPSFFEDEDQELDNFDDVDGGGDDDER